jgi:hypothetical protein
MSMRIHKLTTYLQPEEAHTLVEFLDQLRDTLMQTYGDEIRAMLQEAITTRDVGSVEEDEEPF